MKDQWTLQQVITSFFFFSMKIDETCFLAKINYNSQKAVKVLFLFF